MRGEDQGGQLQLLPARAPGVRRASLLLAELTGFEHAAPDGELVELIAKLGLLQPVVVTGSPEAGYRLIEGRRRAKVIAMLAEQRRWPTPARVDALILTGIDTGGATVPAGMTLALHASRSDSPASELAAIETILDHGGEEARTIKQIAAQTGMAVQTVRRRLRLRSLTPALRVAFERGGIAVSVAEAAARLSADRQALLEQLVQDGQRATHAAVREIARERTASAAEALPAGLFDDHSVSWAAIARGHLHAALVAVPSGERHGALTAAIADALGLLDTGRQASAGQGELAIDERIAVETRRAAPIAGATVSELDANRATILGEAAAKRSASEQRLLEELGRAAAFLHRHGCGDGAVAVNEAIHRLQAMPQQVSRAEQ